MSNSRATEPTDSTPPPAMRVGKIGHASVVVRTAEVCCFMDPVLLDPFESGANRFDPPIEVDVAACREQCNLLVLSHAHMDHFSPRSLAQFRRSVPVIYPVGDQMIEYALDRLGFTDRRAVAMGERIRAGDLTLMPTSSKVSFPEMGMLFQAGGRVFWNLVDTVVDERVIGAVRSMVPQIDLLFAKFQPLVETELRSNALGSDFPAERYGSLLRAVWAIAPRCVAPGSCGYLYTKASWLNDRGFPITEQQFAADLRAVMPQLSVVHVPHGGALDVGAESRLASEGLSFARRVGPQRLPAFDWRPERGVPELVDTNPREIPLPALRSTVAEVLDDRFLSALSAADPVWLERMARLQVLWRLEVIFPEGAPLTRHLDLAARPLTWSQPQSDVFVKLHTSVTASAVQGLVRGELNSYALGFGELRVANRLYSVHRGGVTNEGSPDDDPLCRVLCEDADQRYLESELANILAGPPCA